MKACGYVRVSTQEQVDGYSISEQTERLQKYCEAKDWTLAKIYTDPGYSGGKLDRPAMQQLIRECKQYDMVLVYKLDRLSRSQKDTLYLIEDVFKKNGVEFSSMQENFDTSTPLGMAMVGILSVFAQFEREQIKERMMLGMEGRVKEGYWPGGNVPTGYKYNRETKTLDIYEPEAEQIRTIFDMFLSGKTIRQIGIYAATHYPNKTYQSVTNIASIIDNPAYAGDMRYKGVIYPNTHAPIIPRETFNQAQAMRENRAKRNLGKQRHLLTGIIWCGECGRRMVYHTVHQYGKTYGYYRCIVQSRATQRYENLTMKCSTKAIRSERIEGMVIDKLKQLKVSDVKSPKPKDNTKQLQSIDRQIDKAMQLFTVDGIDLDKVKKMIADLNEKRSRLENTRVESVEPARSALREMDDILSGDDFERQIRLINALIRRVTVSNDNISIELTFM